MNHAIRSSQFFDAAGPAGAPPIVLVHGSVVTRKMWLPQLRGLADEYCLIAPDLPGHGAMAHVPFTMTAAADTVADLIARETPGSAVIVGMSLGGYVAMELAARHPGLAAGLVLSGCSVNFVGPLSLYLKAVGALMRHGWLSQSKAQAERRVRRMFPAGLADVADAQLQAGVYPQALGATFMELAGKDFTTVLASYPGPSMILNGARDSASRRGQPKFASVQRQGRAQLVLEAGHACNLDQPEAYNQALRDFGQSIQ